MGKIFIVVLNWNGKTDSLECLKSIRELRIRNLPAGKAGYELSIIVVDNGSTDRSVEEIEKRYKDLPAGEAGIKILRNDKNLGFAAGNNVGIRYALENGADWVVILNNDTVVPENFLDLLENEADIIGPVIKFKRDGRWVYDYG